MPWPSTLHDDMLWPASYTCACSSELALLNLSLLATCVVAISLSCHAPCMLPIPHGTPEVQTSATSGLHGVLTHRLEQIHTSQRCQTPLLAGLNVWLTASNIGASQGRPPTTCLSHSSNRCVRCARQPIGTPACKLPPGSSSRPVTVAVHHCHQLGVSPVGSSITQTGPAAPTAHFPPTCLPRAAWLWLLPCEAGFASLSPSLVMVMVIVSERRSRMSWPLLCCCVPGCWPKEGPAAT